MFKCVFVIILCVFCYGCSETPDVRSTPTDRVRPTTGLDRKELLQLVARAPQNPNVGGVLTDTDPDVFFINGVVDYVSKTGKSVTLNIQIANLDRLVFDDELIIWITAFENPELLNGVSKGNRYTFKVKPVDADRAFHLNEDDFLWEYHISCELIQVI